MTRDEAIQKVTDEMSRNTPHPTAFVDSLVALGLLRLSEDETLKLAARKIAGSQIVMRYGTNDVVTYLTGHTATELIDTLTKADFRITC